jgi:hypothetical protein
LAKYNETSAGFARYQALSDAGQASRSSVVAALASADRLKCAGDEWIQSERPSESGREEILQLPTWFPQRSVMQVLEEQNDQSEQRHREQLALARRHVEAAEAMARAAKDSEDGVRESLAVAKKSLMWTRLALWLALAVAAGGAFVAYLGA